ncbi:MAG: hypothetical protein K2X93_13900 [Candidatus Obscuribacterales bacterium]|nr:hypothetical protein [Candidatus Obscuribacterales bacterium]
MARPDDSGSKHLEIAQAKTSSSQDAGAKQQKSVTEKSLAETLPDKSAVQQKPLKDVKAEPKGDSTEKKDQPVAGTPKSPAQQTAGNKKPITNALTTKDPSKLGKNNTVMQAQAELEIQPDPIADAIFKAFHYITIAALGGSAVFGTMWYIRHKKRLASGFYDEEDDDEDEEEEPAEKSKKADTVEKEAPKSPSPTGEANGDQMESKSDSAPQPVGSDESK